MTEYAYIQTCQFCVLKRSPRKLTSKSDDECIERCIETIGDAHEWSITEADILMGQGFSDCLHMGADSQ